MASSTPFFKAFGPLLFGRAAAGAIKKLARLDSLQELYELFGHLFPESLLGRAEEGVNSRERTFTPQVTFWQRWELGSRLHFVHLKRRKGRARYFLPLISSLR